MDIYKKINIRQNNHRKDAKNPIAILAWRQFQQEGHKFNSQDKFEINNKPVNTSSFTDISCERLIKQENF